jgi:uncharacterized protein
MLQDGCFTQGTTPMFVDFFLALRQQGLHVSLREYLDLLRGLQAGTIRPSLEEFYYLSRSLLIKQEGQLDAFDLVFGRYFRGKVGMDEEAFWEEVPEDWLRSELEKLIDPDDIRTLEEIGGLEALMARFKELLREQEEGHAGGNTYIGSGGSSPYGQGGLFEGGMRISDEAKHLGQASKVWDRRQYRNLRDDLDLDTRDIKLVLRRLRELTREGRPTELDLDETIRRTSDNAGMLDLRLRPSRKNRVKVLLFLDIGGSMDDYVHRCEQLFSAARYEFKHLEHYYLHNCLYEHVWRDNRRRFGQRIPTWEVLHSYPPDYKVIFVGDASMSPLELTHAGGSVEHWNEEPGLLWLQRVRERFPQLVWINPTPEAHWDFSHSTQLLKQFTQDRMYPMTLGGLGEAMRALKTGR